jgi:hypothetical protein
MKLKEYENPYMDFRSEITCPECGYKKIEKMTTNICAYFYECQGCETLLKSLIGDCCVFCSFGSIKCPSIQMIEL